MSSCCFQSPITYLGSGQYWVNITVFESNPIDNNSFTVLFGSLYHFPLPIVIDQYQKPAPCRLDNPNDLDSGSMWTCMGKEARFRIDTNPKGVDPVVHQLSTKSFGECYGRPVCTSTVDDRTTEVNPSRDQEENKVSLGALGTFDKGPVIAAFTLSSLVVIGLAALYFYRNRHKKEPLGHCPSREPAAAPDNRSFSQSEEKKSTLLDSITKPDKTKARRPMVSGIKSLLAVMDEKLDKPKSSERQKIFFKNQIEDNRSDKSNVPLAILYKK